jgi:hypothetical protein
MNVTNEACSTPQVDRAYIVVYRTPKSEARTNNCQKTDSTGSKLKAASRRKNE